MDQDGFRRDPRHSELVEINQQIHGHNERIKNIARVAQQTNNTTNQVATELGKQREVINKNIQLNHQIKQNVRMVDKRTREMIRRNLCIKLTLWLIIIALFAVNIGLLIWRLKTPKPSNS